MLALACGTEGAIAPFVSQAEFELRTQLGQSEMSLLAKADVFRSLRTGRRMALWNALPAPDHSPLFASVHSDEHPVSLPSMTAVQEVVADYQTAGLSLHGHPFQFLRADLDRCGVTPNARLAYVESKRRYRIAGGSADRSSQEVESAGCRAIVRDMILCAPA